MAETPNEKAGEAHQGKGRDRHRRLLRKFRLSPARFRLGRVGQRVLFALVLVAGLSLLAALFLPYRQYMDQEESVQRAEQELVELREQRTQMEERLEKANDPIEKERYAREQMSLVYEGDEIFRVVVPDDVLQLPEGWHLPGVAFLVTGKLP